MYLTRDEFLKRVEQSGSKYWQEGKNYRWQYMSYVIDILREMFPNGGRFCEAGASGILLYEDSCNFEYPQHDLNKIPYRILGGHVIPDNFFDCFVALQVWEHLDNQAVAFREVMRIAKSAILSFPYKWTWGDKRHKGIDGKKIEKWTCGVVPEKIKIINHRAIYTFKFE
jgi:hypothetical protein